MTYFRICVLTVISLRVTNTSAQFRKYSNEFLNIGAGARGLGMGGAQVASVADATAGYWNPAGLTEIKEHPVASLMHAEYFAGIGKYDYASIAMPIGDPTVVTRSLGFSLIRFAVDDIPNTLFLVEPDGSVNYNNIMSFSSADYALLVSYGQVILSIACFGFFLSIKPTLKKYCWSKHFLQCPKKYFLLFNSQQNPYLRIP